VALLLFFLAAIPRWIDFFTAKRGKEVCWKLNSSRDKSLTTKVSDESTEKLDEKKRENVAVKIGEVEQGENFRC